MFITISTIWAAKLLIVSGLAKLSINIFSTGDCLQRSFATKPEKIISEYEVQEP